MRRVALTVAVLVVGVSAVVTAVRGPEALGLPSLASPAPAVSYEPADGATDVNPGGGAGVTVAEGRLDRVALTGQDGKPVKGEASADQRSWKTTENLRYGSTYRWAGTATAGDGQQVELTGSLSTLAPASQVRATLNIGDNRTVGIAAPIAIQFNAHVQDRAAAERALKVTTSIPTEGAWGWLPDEGGGSRVHWRPKEYWKAGTKVTVAAELFGVRYGNGAYGSADITSKFVIGRAQIVRADVRTFQMVVLRDEVPVATYPASFGLDADPNRNTRSGIHVVTEKFTDKRMVSQQFGYDLMAKWAVRMSNNGEFIHAAPGTVGVQGSANVSHGCVNLSPEAAKQYYDTAIYGDPVEVTGSNVQLTAKDGDIWDWTLSWGQWQELSAL